MRFMSRNSTRVLASLVAGCLGTPRPAAVPRPASVLGGDYEFSGRVDRYVVSGAVALDSRGGAALSFRSASGWIGWIPRALAKQ